MKLSRNPSSLSFFRSMEVMPTSLTAFAANGKTVARYPTGGNHTYPVSVASASCLDSISKMPKNLSKPMDTLTDLKSMSTSMTLTSGRPSDKAEASSTLTNYSSFMVSIGSSVKKITPTWQPKPTDYSKPLSSSLETSGPSSMSSST